MRTRLEKAVLAMGLLLILFWAYRRLDAQQTVGGQVFIVSSDPVNCTLGSLYFNTTSGLLSVCKTTDTLVTAMVAPLRGATGTITGTLLAAGACNSGTATVTGAVAGQSAKANTSDGTFIGGGFTVNADVTSNNIATVNICAVFLSTPPSKSYNVMVNP